MAEVREEVALAAPAPERACDRCGNFAELVPRGTRHVCDDCLAKLPLRRVETKEASFGGLLVDASRVGRPIFWRALLACSLVDLPLAVWVQLDREPAQWVFFAYEIAEVVAAGAIVRMALKHANEERFDMGTELFDSAARWPSMVAASILVTVGTLLGTFLLLIPGLWVMTTFALGPAVAAVETRNPIEALARSARRMVGSRVSFFFASSAVGLTALFADLLTVEAIGALGRAWPPEADPLVTDLVFRSTDVLVFLVQRPFFGALTGFVIAALYLKTWAAQGSR